MKTRFRFGWILLLVLGFAVPSHAAESRFQDDFNRPDGPAVGNDWNTTPNHNDCPPPKGAKKPARAKEGESAKGESAATGVDPKNPLYDEISREIEKKTGKKGAANKPKEPKKESGDEFQGVTARIRDGMLFFQYAENQDAQMVQREFPRPLTQLSYDFTPLYAMGGLDDRAWIGARIFYLDASDLILGEIRHFFYQSDFPDQKNSDTVHVIVQKGNFDGTARHADIDLQRILEQRLKGVDRKKIAKTRLSFEAATGLCSSSVEAYVDNVVATFGAGVEPFRVSREILLEIAESGVERFSKDRQGFPGNWKNGVFEKYGKQPITAWLNEMPAEARNDLQRLTDHLMQRYALTGKDAWLAGYAVMILLQTL
ncbi:MAG: hypothetical protein HQL95_06975 [Magnetococcales bacterium]|nr:hypothetical protein [Magnetococcales bacterium]